MGLLGVVHIASLVGHLLASSGRSALLNYSSEFHFERFQEYEPFPKGLPPTLAHPVCPKALPALSRNGPSTEAVDQLRFRSSAKLRTCLLGALGPVQGGGVRTALESCLACGPTLKSGQPCKGVFSHKWLLLRTFKKSALKF